MSHQINAAVVKKKIILTSNFCVRYLFCHLNLDLLNRTVK